MSIARCTSVRPSLAAAAAAIGVAGVVMSSGCGGGGEPEAPVAPAGSPAADTEATTATAAAAKPPAFEDVAADVGLAWIHDSGTTGGFLFPEILGSGVALLDIDGDGDLDVWLVQGGMLDPEAAPEDRTAPPPPDQPAGDRVFRNELVPSGELRFVDITEESGVDHRTYGMGLAVGDYDNDGDPDVYVTALGSNVLYRNDGDGRFTDVTATAGVGIPTWSTSASWLDHDGDGDLDLFVVDYVAWSMDLDMVCTSASGNRDYCGPQNYRSLQDHLFRNDGDGRFTDVSDEAGMGAARGAGLGVIATDLNLDGHPDLFVANDGEANHVWMNRGDGTFDETGLLSGAALNRVGSAEASMGVGAGDIDGDGDDDLFVTHLINETNTLYRNDGTGTFTDDSARSGLGAASRPMTGFGTAFFDHDGDGHLDLYIANGNVKVDEFRAGMGDDPLAQINQLFRNRGDGSFEDVGTTGGDAVRDSWVSRGVAYGDLDNDGDTDMVVTNNAGPVRVFLNRRADPAGWIRFRLEGTDSPRDGAGARVALLRAGQPPIWRRAHSDGSYLSARDSRVLFGLGDSDDEAHDVGVLWPSGRRERWDGNAAGAEHDLVEGSGSPWPEAG